MIPKFKTIMIPKSKTIVTAAVAITVLLPVSAQVVLEAFLFDDVSGTALNNTTNSGTQGSSWRFGGWTTDGSGNLAFDSGQGTATRKLPARGSANADAGTDFYSPALQWNTGLFSLEIEFDVNYQDNAAGDNISWGINDADGDRLVRFSIREKDGNVEVQFSANNDDSSGRNDQFRTALIGTNDQAYTDLTASILFDFDNNTVDYLFNGSSILGSALDFFVDGTTEIGQFIGSTSGVWNGTSGTNAFNLDTIRLTQVPESDSFALVSGGLALALIMLRRRR